MDGQSGQMDMLGVDQHQDISRYIKIMQHIATPSTDIKRPSPVPCSPSRTRAVSRKQHSIGCKSPVQRREMAPGVSKKNSSWLRKKWDPLGFSSVWIIFLFGSVIVFPISTKVSSLAVLVNFIASSFFQPCEWLSPNPFCRAWLSMRLYTAQWLLASTATTNGNC